MMVTEMPSSTVANRDEECLKKSLMEVVKSDAGNICRLCLSKEQRLTRAFEDERGIDDALLKKIFDCTTVKVKLKTIFPSAICAVCDLKLNEFYKFREKCIENDSFLHNLLDNRGPGAEVDQSVPSVDGQWKEPPVAEGSYAHGKESQAEQQAATSTTSIPEGQKDGGDVMAIALNQLSSFGLRPLQDLIASANGGDGGGLRPAENVLLPGVVGGNIVSSSSAPSQQHDGPAPSLLSSFGLTVAQQRQMEQDRTFALAALEMAGLQALRATSEGNGPGVVSAHGGGKYECAVCHRMFRNAYTLRRHTNLHTETNLFPCEYCGKKFNDRSNWKIHQRTHTGDNLYTCLVCLKTFISPSTLKYHRRSHRRLESFDCRLCSATFGNYDQLEEHARFAHQDVQDFQSEEPLIDAASFVKIELEDGELSSSTAVEDVSTTCGPPNGAENEDDEDGERRMVDSSSLDELQRTELHQRQQLLDLMQHQFKERCAVAEDTRIENQESDTKEFKQELDALDHDQREQENAQHQHELSQNEPRDAEVKEEPLDETMDLDASELLQQAMEEAEGDDNEADEKELSSSPSSPSTVILFRCDYCMKIFHFLDELNAHMLLHNGTKQSTTVGPVVLGSASTSTTSAVPISVPRLAIMRSEAQTFGHVPLLPKSPLPLERIPMRKSKRRRTAFPPTSMANRAPPTPPKYPCSKCAKMFRTEELRRVHEATHANDEQASKVRSCRICSKVFKCELNLLAHMRKHSLMDRPPADAETVGDSSGNDESSSSCSNGAGDNSHELTQHPAEDSDEGEMGPTTSPEASPEVGSAPARAGTAQRRCEICAISLKDSAALDKHMLCHFERNEAIAFVPQNERPFQCTECHKSFKRKDYLLIHIRTHTGERRYKCDLCTSAFVHPSNLITHRKLHSNERPHHCTLCGSRFKLFAGLKIHRRRCEQKLPKGWPDGIPPGFGIGLNEHIPNHMTSYPYASNE